MKLKKLFLYKLKDYPASLGIKRRQIPQDRGVENKKDAPNFLSGFWKIQVDAPALTIRRYVSLWGFLKSKWELNYGQVRFRLMDINCLVYLTLIGFLLIFFHKGVINWPLHMAIHAVLVVSILEIIRLGEKHP